MSSSCCSEVLRDAADELSRRGHRSAVTRLRDIAARIDRDVTTYECDLCPPGEPHRADHQPPAVDCDRSHCQASSETCRVCVSHARDEARN